MGEAYGTMRKRFEPLWEAKVAARRVAALERMRDGMLRRVDDCTLALEKEEEKRAAAAALHDAAREKYLRAHRNWLRALLNRTAMVKLANDAMAFSKNTLELYDNLEKASKQQVYDAFEDASSHIWLQRKRESIKEERRRMAARLVLFASDQRVPHEVRPVTGRGATRYAIALWFLSPPAAPHAPPPEAAVAADVTDSDDPIKQPGVVRDQPRREERESETSVIAALPMG